MNEQNIYQGAYYRYSIPLLQNTLTEAKTVADKYKCKLHYALKANNEERIVQEVQQAGLGLDCVTAYEIEHGMKNGFRPNQIVFAGSGKTIREIQTALRLNIDVIHCESIEEYDIIVELKNELNSTTKIALRINPDIQVGTHAKISTGEKHHKFGLSWEEAESIISSENEVVGFHFHVGSQILDNSYFEELSLRVRELLSTIDNPQQYTYLNLGGGLGINYVQPERYSIPDFEGWMKAIRTHLPTSFIAEIRLEPGRSIVAQCGQLICEVQYIKDRGNQKLAILDVGMSEILRPALYGSHHKITSVAGEMEFLQYIVSGPSCESSDTFGDNYFLPELKRGDILTIHSVGAYGSSMRLNYNMRPQLPSLYLQETKQTAFKAKRRLAS